MLTHTFRLFNFSNKINQQSIFICLVFMQSRLSITDSQVQFITSQVIRELMPLFQELRQQVKHHHLQLLNEQTSQGSLIESLKKMITNSHVHEKMRRPLAISNIEQEIQKLKQRLYQQEIQLKQLKEKDMHRTRELLVQRSISPQRYSGSRAEKVDRITDKQKKIKNNFISIENIDVLDKHEEPQKEQKPEIVDSSSKYLSKFIIVGNEIRKKQYDNQCYQLVGKIPIKTKKINKFEILKTQQKYLYFGIVDARYIDDRDSDSLCRSQCICYNALTGNVSVGGQLTGTDGRKGANEGQAIIMKVSGDIIEWKVGLETRAQFYNLMIKDRSIRWVPFIGMWNKDRIRWS